MENERIILENFVLWYTCKNRQEGHFLYEQIDIYLDNEDYN